MNSVDMIDLGRTGQWVVLLLQLPALAFIVSALVVAVIAIRRAPASDALEVLSVFIHGMRRRPGPTAGTTAITSQTAGAADNGVGNGDGQEQR
ncbi:hypothetical protein [Nocardia sp. NPDC048505]|uniref:hypothetical protein n=1 Tax=unclassified Nocardia TaxID=2637762 RepID=UPI00340D4CFE